MKNGTQVLATFNGKKVRGKVVGKDAANVLIHIAAADIPILQALKYHYDTVVVPARDVVVR